MKERLINDFLHPNEEQKELIKNIVYAIHKTTLDPMQLIGCMASVMYVLAISDEKISDHQQALNIVVMNYYMNAVMYYRAMMKVDPENKIGFKDIDEIAKYLKPDESNARDVALHRLMLDINQYRKPQ